MRSFGLASHKGDDRYKENTSETSQIPNCWTYCIRKIKYCKRSMQKNGTEVSQILYDTSDPPR